MPAGGTMNFWPTLHKPFTILAPMEEVTDTVFRHLVAGLGAPDVFFSEFIHATDYLHPKRHNEKKYAHIDPAETFRPLVAQIWGNSPEDYRRAVPLLLEKGFSGIDINMGCPAVKKVRRGCCAGLINNPTLASELIQAAREAAGPYPVSVKTRLGVKTKKTVEWAGFLLSLDLPVLSIHGRIADQMSEGEAEWTEIAEVVKLRDQMGKSTLIVGNGDLFSTDLLDSRPTETGVDGLMVGRGIFRDPYIFRPDRPHAPFGLAPVTEKLAVLERHLLEHRRVWGGLKGYDMLKAFIKIYTAGFDGCLDLRQALMETHSHDEGLGVLAAWQAAHLSRF